MSKKLKSARKQPLPVKKKTVAPPPAIKAKNGDERPVTPPVQKTMPPAPSVKAEPAFARQEREAALPFWARMPFAVMDFWMARAARKDTKSESRS